MEYQSFIDYKGKTKSVPNMLVGDGTFTLVTPTSGKRLYVRALTVVANGNTGTVMIQGADATIYLPLWVAVQNRGSTSSVLNIELDIDEPLSVVCLNRGANETFIGVTYYEG